MSKYNAIANRFIKGFLSGALTAVSMVTYVQPTTWKEASGWLAALTTAAVFGGINGALLALQKWYAWKE